MFGGGVGVGDGGDGDDGGGDGDGGSHDDDGGDGDYFFQAENEISSRRDAVARTSVEAR